LWQSEQVYVVVTGGTGGLGREVVARLRDRDNRVMAASRRTGVDLRTGEGLRRVMQGADVIVHAASHPTRYRKVDLDGTRRMIKILQDRPDPPHLVYVSIVGCDRNPYPYYRAKYACELVLERSGLPVTVVRATQFHTLVATLAGIFAHGPVSVQPQMAFQPCDHLWVADRLVEAAVGEPPPGYRRASDLAGPEVTTLGEAVELVRRKAGKSRSRAITLPAVGGMLKAFAAGTNLPGPDAVIGGLGFGEWLRTVRP
jgi:uncharacterized protein YbjT (DUF2867 family)